MTGDMFVIQSNSPHAIKQKKPYDDVVAISLLFSEQYMKSCVEDYEQLAIEVFPKKKLSKKQEKEMYALKKTFYKLIGTCETSSTVNVKLKQTILVNEILYTLVTHFSMKAKQPTITNEANEQIKFINTFIKNNFHKKMIVQKLSTEMYLTTDHISRLYKRGTGRTLSSQINMIRLHEAYKLLSEQRYTVDYIADFCGFSTTSYFIKQFKHEFEITPKKLEQTLRKNPEV